MSGPVFGSEGLPQRLAGGDDLLGVARHLETRALGRVLEAWEILSSTNDRAKGLARLGAVHGTTVVARAQTAGRGQRGRTWHSPPGAGLYVSFVVRPRLAARQAPTLTLLAGVALHDALLAASGVKTLIKWPNDLLADHPHFGRKVAGILVEVAADPKKIEHAIIGLGVNLREVERPGELAAYATSIERVRSASPAPVAHDLTEVVSSRSPVATDPALDPGRIVAAIAGALEVRIEEAEARGFGPVLDAWTRRAACRGEVVEVDTDGVRSTGVLEGVAEDGALLLGTAGGTRTVYRGELQLPGAPRRPSASSG